MAHDVSLTTTATQGSCEFVHRQLVSISTLADRWECSEKHVRRLISQGKLTGYRVGKRLLGVDMAEAERLVRQIPTAS